MSRYVLGENAARKFRALISGNSSSATGLSTASDAWDLDYPNPWSLRFAASVQSGEEDEGEDPQGAWILFVPDGSWSGATVETDEESPNYMRPAGNPYLASYYVVPESVAQAFTDFGPDDWKTTELYADGSSGKIVLHAYAEGFTSHVGIHIATVECSKSGIRNVYTYARSVITGAMPRPFEIASKSVTTAEGDTTLTVVFMSPYFRIGGRTYTASQTALVPDFDGGILAAVLNAETGAFSQYVVYADFAALQTAESDTQKYVIPLYALDDAGGVTLDFRSAPQVAMSEF